MKWIAVLVLALVSCGGDDDRYTKGEYCDAVTTAACRRAVACGLDTFDGCFQGVKASCCITNGTCGLVATETDRDRADRCSAAMPGHACSEIARGVLPSVCLTSR